MNFFPFLHFFCFLVYVYLAVYIILKNPRSSLNKTCASLISCFALWTFSVIFIHNPETPKDIVRLLENIACIGWISFSVFFLWFVLIFTRKKKILKMKIVYLLFFILPLLFIYKQWTNYLIVDYVRQPYGWSYIWSDSIWPNMFYLYYLSMIVLGLYLILDFARKTDDLAVKKQSKIIFFSTFVAVFIGSVTNVLLQELRIYTMPDIGDMIGLIWVFGIVHSIVAYKFLVITPATAAENIVSTMTDCLILLDQEGNITNVNKATLELLEYKRGELKGKSFDILITEKDFKTALLEKIVEGENIKNHDLKLKTKTDGDILVNFSTSVLKDEAGSIAGIVCISTDITARKKVEEILRKCRDELEERVKARTLDLARINQELHMDIAERRRTEKKLAMLNDELIRSNKRLKQLTLKDFHTGLYNHRYLTEVISAEFDRARRYGTTISVLMLDIDYFKSINNVYGHHFGDVVLKQFARQLKMMVRRYDVVIRYGGEEFIIILPGTDRATSLILAQRILDAINIYNFGDNKNVVKLKLSMAVVSAPEDEIIKSMNLIALAEKILAKAKEDGGGRVYSSVDTKNSALSISDKAKEIYDVKILEGKIDRLNKQAHQGLTEAILAFAKTIEVKDHYTGEHVENTVRYATRIARALDLPKDEIERIRQATILHDLGKIGISENHLHKKSKLTQEEYENIKRHPQIGVDIIRPIRILHDIIPFILYHHERWDGNGYPSGLKGEEIPVGARIIAIADVYQALSSDRPYRKAFSKKEAVKILKDGSGTQFDPRITDIFLKILEKEKP